MAFCTGCGNEVENPATCPICAAGRGSAIQQPEAVEPERPELGAGQCGCPRCNEALETEDFDGTAALCCASCRGTFFPDRSLETVLNKLRATCDPMDPDSVLREFKDRFRRELPNAVRYKACPVCETIMSRRNYGAVSGVVIDECPDHGTWVDSNAFAALADFICRGGDVLSQKASSLRNRVSTAKRQGGTGGKD